MDLLIIMPSNPWVIETEHGMRGGGWVGGLRRKAFKLQALAWHPSIISFTLLLNADISQISTAYICSVQNTQLLVLLTLSRIHLPVKILTKLRAVANYEFREEKTRSTMKADTNEAWPIQSKNEKGPRVMCKTHRLGGAGRNRFRKKMGLRRASQIMCKSGGTLPCPSHAQASGRAEPCKLMNLIKDRCMR